MHLFRPFTFWRAQQRAYTTPLKDKYETLRRTVDHPDHEQPLHGPYLYNFSDRKFPFDRTISQSAFQLSDKLAYVDAYLLSREDFNSQVEFILGGLMEKGMVFYTHIAPEIDHDQNGGITLYWGKALGGLKDAKIQDRLPITIALLTNKREVTCPAPFLAKDFREQLLDTANTLASPTASIDLIHDVFDELLPTENNDQNGIKPSYE